MNGTLLQKPSARRVIGMVVGIVIIGLGTLICAFCLGPVIQFFNGHFSEKVLRYQPRKT